jgi:choline dehydrogenase-like flavoprotein
VPRFAPEDFCDGERLHERYRWPLDYADLLPYYERAEPLLCINGDTQTVPNLPAGRPAYRRQLPPDWHPVAQAAAARGQGLTITPVSDGPPWMLARRGTAFNSYTSIILPLLRSPHFQLITGAHALQLEYAPDRQRVEGVVYHDRTTGSRQRIAAAAVVVACGPLNSTKLLFDSACPDFPQGLGDTRGLLGRYLHDHPRDWWTVALEKPLSRPVPSAYLTRKRHKDSAPLYATSWTIGLLPGIREKILGLLPARAEGFGVQVFGTTIPTEEHFVRPDASKKDEFGLPLLDICMRFDEEVTRNVVQAREHFIGLLGEAGYPAKIAETPTTLTPGNSVHYGGTIRMHRSPDHGMVDEWNRLFAVPNVIVGDASCFTTGPEKNPTLTAMALAARAADRLADNLKTGN